MTEENSLLEEEVNEDSEVKKWLVEYVGNKNQPENSEVTVEMIVQTMADEFPDFLIAVAEENWVRGYQQAMSDVVTTEEDIFTSAKKENE